MPSGIPFSHGSPGSQMMASIVAHRSGFVPSYVFSPSLVRHEQQTDHDQYASIFITSLLYPFI